MRAGTFALSLLLILSFSQLASSATLPSAQFCPVSPVRPYMDPIARPEIGELDGYVYTIENNLRKPVQGGLVYRVETKNGQGAGGSSSISGCYMVTNAGGIAAFSYDPQFSGCYSSW